MQMPLARWTEDVYVALAAPWQNTIIGGWKNATWAWQHYIALGHVQTENERLQQENERLQHQLQAQSEIVFENERLRQMLGFQREHNDLQWIYAEVIAIAPSPAFHSIRLNRGSLDGVVLGNAILSPQGVVGRVVGLTEHTAEVMLLVDNNSSLDVLIQRSRTRARIRGQGTREQFSLEIEYLPRTADVVPGDVLVSGGLSKTFPKGLIVGYVTHTTKPNFGLYQQGKARPAVHFTQLESVWILKTPP
jgi:rod shape-determining protein MreC